MHLHRQRGALSLLWTAVFVAIFAFAAMAALFSMRYNRNLFAEAWAGLMRTAGGQAVQQVQASVKPEPVAITKCTINGKVVYSNVECGQKNPTSRKVELHDTRGIEAPKAPPPAASASETPPTMQDKMIEKAVAR